MSGRSSPHSLAQPRTAVPSAIALAASVVFVSGCKNLREADPAQVTALAARMVDNSPVPAAVPTCSEPELASRATLTFSALRLLAGQTLDRTVEETKDWVNPTALDAAAALTLLDATSTPTARRQAAGDLLGAPSWVVYRVDLVNAPMAVGVKELKTGMIAGRIIRYDRASGRPTCVTQWNAQNSRDKTDWAISISNKPYIDPAVASVLRDDLVAQYLARVSRNTANAKQ